MALPPAFKPAALLGVGAACLLLLRRAVPAFGAADQNVLACGAVLVFGMPHGSLDLERLTAGGAERGRALLVYLACALGMYLVWRSDPGAALAVFLGLSVWHFAEDWSACPSLPLRLGAALAILAAPMLLHGREVAEIFFDLTLSSEAGAIADLLRMAAPAALLLAFLAGVALVRRGAIADAFSLGMSILVLMALPPVEGFALFFCLIHSPKALAEALTSLNLGRAREAGPALLVMTLAALVLAAALFWGVSDAAPGRRWIFATFVSLSVLTAPHMLAPLLLRRAPAAGRGGRERLV